MGRGGRRGRAGTAAAVGSGASGARPRAATSRASCTGCAASSPRPSGRTELRASTAASRPRGSRCCASPRGTSTLPWPRSAAWWTRAEGSSSCPTMLSARVEIMLAAGDVAEARRAADELVPDRRHDGDAAPAGHGRPRRAVRCCSPKAMHATRSASARRRVRRVARPRDAVRDRRAQVQIGLACRALGDHDAADFELDAARTTFERLGARPDLDAGPAVERPCRSTGSRS